MDEQPFRHGGTRVLVTLHERYLRDFLEVWRKAEHDAVELPETSDPSYASREVLLAHVLGCAARYLAWICEQVGMDPPSLEQHPQAEGLASRADEYLEQVLAAWRGPSLRSLTGDQVHRTAYASRWGTPYCVDAMLEHAVMHPIRHAHQLRCLMGISGTQGTLHG